jgi:hypothetical protein
MPAERHLWLMVGLGALWLSPACRDTAFVCSSDDQCLREGEAGVCQPDGWCSFADPVCSSGQRYAKHAGDGLARSCVPESDDSTTGVASGSSSSADVTTSDPSTTSSGSSTTSSGSSTTSSGSSTTWGPGDPSSSGAASSTDEGSTSAGPEPCSLVEDFAVGEFANPWVVGGPLDLTFVDGMVGWQLVSSMEAAYGWAYTDPLDLTGRSVEVEVGAPPPAAGNAQLMVELQTPAISYLTVLEGAGLFARAADNDDGSWVVLGSETYDHAQTLRLRMTEVDGVLLWEYSNDDDDDDWNVLASASISRGFDVEHVNVALVAGTWTLEDEVGFVGFSSLAICP